MAGEQEGDVLHGAHRYNTMFASLGVKTLLDVEGDGNAWLNHCGVLRDGIQILRMHQEGKRGGTDSLDEAGGVHSVERGSGKLAEAGLWIGGEGDKGYLLHIVEILNRGRKQHVSKGVEPKQESLWWTSTHATDVEGSMVNEGAGAFLLSRSSTWDTDTKEWEVRGSRMRMCTAAKQSASRGKAKVVSHVYSVASNCVNWSWSQEKMKKVK